MCTEKAKSFIDSNEIVNREELKEALDAIVKDTGHFVCLYVEDSENAASHADLEVR